MKEELQNLLDEIKQLLSDSKNHLTINKSGKHILVGREKPLQQIKFNKEASMQLNCIAAVSLNGIIGDQNSNDIPWKGRYKEDFQFFRKMTMGGEVIFGRRTFDSIGNKPLPKRSNVVITRSKSRIENVQCFETLDQYIRNRSLILEDQATTKWICGGSNLYREALLKPEIQELYITIIPEIVQGENLVSFPWINPFHFQIQEVLNLEGSELKVLKYCRIN